MSKNGDIVIISRKMCCNTTGVIRLIYNYSTGFSTVLYSVLRHVSIDLSLHMYIYIICIYTPTLPFSNKVPLKLIY